MSSVKTEKTYFDNDVVIFNSVSCFFNHLSEQIFVWLYIFFKVKMKQGMLCLFNEELKTVKLTRLVNKTTWLHVCFRHQAVLTA